jgi:hypothetical protein
MAGLYRRPADCTPSGSKVGAPGVPVFSPPLAVKSKPPAVRVVADPEIPNFFHSMVFLDFYGNHPHNGAVKKAWASRKDAKPQSKHDLILKFLASLRLCGRHEILIQFN